MGLDTVELVMWAEEEFAIEISDEEASKIFTVGMFSGFIFNKLKSNLALTITESEVYRRLTDILVERYAIDRNDIQSNSRFVQDLGLD